jgi:hypothetical protein
MSNLTLQFKLLDNQKEISRKILEALLPLVKDYFENITKNLSNDIADIIISYIKNEPEYESLINGTLKYEFGIPDAKPRLDFILNHIKTSGITKVQNPIIRGNKIVASYVIQLVKSDFENLLSIGSASFTTEKGQELEWLRWLLIEGDTIIITGYEFEFGPNIGSRTGMGIMKMGNSWRVPPEFAGNISSNWITRGINSAVSEIDQYLNKIMGI